MLPASLLLLAGAGVSALTLEIRQTDSLGIPIACSDACATVEQYYVPCSTGAPACDQFCNYLPEIQACLTCVGQNAGASSSDITSAVQGVLDACTGDASDSASADVVAATGTASAVAGTTAQAGSSPSVKKNAASHTTAISLGVVGVALAAFIM
ncbi:uncharacterized protein EHS24_006331 [Apiotrichum porosum]|uniref:Extracellular membrane protein CFEM domain-containing protein n=1 Tax=Apiotrichum porosum TaxID=105984 RepID=A0A427Y0W5_9TREE|nr:uncharacterized protein EHS24_006331 [Apiotrichum porosum]RSH84804.1 hypothetical protein EHS24_006331 [Apiotrichum porosum]